MSTRIENHIIPGDNNKVDLGDFLRAWRRVYTNSIWAPGGEQSSVPTIYGMAIGSNPPALNLYNLAVNSSAVVTLYFTTAGGSDVVPLLQRYGANTLGTSMGLNTTTLAAIGGKAHVDTTAVGNVTTGEDTLMTYTLPANSLSAGGKGVRVTVIFEAGATVNGKTHKLYFGGTNLLNTGSLTNGGVTQTGKMVAEIFSTGTDAQFYSAYGWFTGYSTTMFASNGTLTKDDGAAIIIHCTGEATATNDIIQKFMLVEFFN